MHSRPFYIETDLVPIPVRTVTNISKAPFPFLRAFTVFPAGALSGNILYHGEYH
jgi:hypothetical protein